MKGFRWPPWHRHVRFVLRYPQHITQDHFEKMKNKVTVGIIEILDMAAQKAGMQIDNIMPQMERPTFSDGRGVIVLA